MISNSQLPPTILKRTRMHSSRMRTARLLTVSQHALLGGVPARGVCICQGGVPVQGGVPAQEGVYLPGGTCPGRGVYLPGSVPAQVPPP